MFCRSGKVPLIHIQLGNEKQDLQVNLKSEIQAENLRSQRQECTTQRHTARQKDTAWLSDHAYMYRFET